MKILVFPLEWACIDRANYLDSYLSSSFMVCLDSMFLASAVMFLWKKIQEKIFSRMQAQEMTLHRARVGHAV